MYQLRWQRAAHRALGEFLQVNGMPAIAWTIATSGALVGDVDLLATTPEKQRATFEAWVKQLGAKVIPERVTAEGVAHLYAQFSWARDSAAPSFRAPRQCRATIAPLSSSRTPARSSSA